MASCLSRNWAQGTADDAAQDLDLLKVAVARVKVEANEAKVVVVRIETVTVEASEEPLPILSNESWKGTKMATEKSARTSCLNRVEPHLPFELAVSLRGMPGRHVAALGDELDHGAALLDVAVARQRERGDLAGAVAGRAALEHDRCHVLTEGDLPVQRAGGGRKGGEEGQGESSVLHHGRVVHWVRRAGGRGLVGGILSGSGRSRAPAPSISSSGWLAPVRRSLSPARSKESRPTGP